MQIRVFKPLTMSCEQFIVILPKVGKTLERKLIGTPLHPNTFVFACDTLGRKLLQLYFRTITLIFAMRWV